MKKTKVLTPTPITKAFIDPIFDAVVGEMQDNFNAAEADHLFEVDAGNLYEIYLNNLPEDARQHHTCHCCKRFFEQYGNIAFVDNDGDLISPYWGLIVGFPAFYQPAIDALIKAISRSKITGIAYRVETTWGTSLTANGWTHFAVTPPKAAVWANGSRMPGKKDQAILANQAAAKLKEDHRTLMHGLGEYKKETVAQALTLLDSEALYRSEKVLGAAQFLMKCHEIRDGMSGVDGKNTRRRHNLLWLQVAKAPVGFCQPRSSMIGTLLDDIEARLSFEAIRSRFAQKMSPLLYQRPQAAPTIGAIEAAEKLVAEMGIEESLHRRFARVEEIRTIWQQAPIKEPVSGGVFGHLKAKSEPTALDMPAMQITWDKFAKTVLPNARKIQVWLSGNNNIAALVTATNSEAPPIIQWDLPENRNPFSWYVYHGGSTAEQWSLRSNAWINVPAITLKPSNWDNMSPHHGNGAILILEGAKDTRKEGLGLFPEILKSSLHSVRGVIEAHSKKGEITGREESTANGLVVGDSSYRGHKIRVTTSYGAAVYQIDRWD